MCLGVFLKFLWDQFELNLRYAGGDSSKVQVRPVGVVADVALPVSCRGSLSSLMLSVDFDS